MKQKHTDTHKQTQIVHQVLVTTLTRMLKSCMSGAATRVCIRVRSRVRSTSQQYKKNVSFIRAGQEKSEISNEPKELSIDGHLPETEKGNRVMVVVDPSVEAKGALEWALSHTVQSQDTIILLHVAKQDGKNNGEIDERAYDLLRSQKSMCQLKRPEVRVEVAIRQGKEKGPTIVEEAKRLKVSLLVLGHRKPSLVWRLRMIWASRRSRSRVVDYCIQNANCMTIAVRRKHRKYGGYLITTKRHKNFWLLA